MERYYTQLIDQIEFDEAQVNFLIADESGKIINANELYMEKYLRSRDGSIEDYNITLNDLFP